MIQVICVIDDVAEIKMGYIYTTPKTYHNSHYKFIVPHHQANRLYKIVAKKFNISNDNTIEYKYTIKGDLEMFQDISISTIYIHMNKAQYRKHILKQLLS